MPDCLTLTCTTGATTPITSSEDGTQSITQNWSLNLAFDGIVLADVTRNFEVKTSKRASRSASKAYYYYEAGARQTGFCNPESTVTMFGSIKELMNGTVAEILYADLTNQVYLVKQIAEEHTFTSRMQNPFEYRDPYGPMESIAYFLTGNKTSTTKYYLVKAGTQLWSKTLDIGSSTYTVTPIIFPFPSQDATFRISEAEYAWLKTDGFYNYNDKSDMGPNPCSSGSLSTQYSGYTIAMADGGKDFFYPDWVRGNFLVGSWIHDFWAEEADNRFYACGNAFKKSYPVTLPVSDEIYGNYMRFDDKDFYSFYLPEINEAIVSLGNADITKSFQDFTSTANIWHPISLI